MTPIPEDEEFGFDRIVFEEQGENSDGADATEELAEAASSSQDRLPERNLRPRTESHDETQPEAREDLLVRTPGVNAQPWKADLLQRNREQLRLKLPHCEPGLIRVIA